MDKDQLSRNRRTALVLGSSLGITLIAVVYAVLQQKEANRSVMFATEMQLKVQSCEKNQIEMMKQIENQNRLLEAKLIELEEAVREAERQKQQAELNLNSRK